MSKFKDTVQNGATGQSFRFQYGEDTDFEAWILDRDSPITDKRIMFPTARLYENGTVKPVPWTSEKLLDYLQSTLRAWRAVYGRQWVLDVRTARRLPVMFDREVGAAGKARARMGDVFKKITDAASPRPVPIKADFDNDPELRIDESRSVASKALSIAQDGRTSPLCPDVQDG